MSENSKKRPIESESEDSSDDWVGPKQTENNQEENSQDSEEVSEKDKFAEIKKRKSLIKIPS